ncbi:hypothetical protein MJ1_0171 [Nanobdella aerobiophila]|uniref:Uncharacterized protein n=1 Tax=Nanobdella aerobiophila TaxID=2586965 RepID=A0A915SFE0_9ARCH|nr:hypothetical protein MJ1_0171 [Nanobdella aerobiophila]
MIWIYNPKIFINYNFIRNFTIKEFNPKILFNLALKKGFILIILCRNNGYKN